MNKIPACFACLVLLAPPGRAATDITFYAVSDPHFGKPGADFALNRAAVVETLNGFPGKTYPASVGGGIIQAPRGVLIAGDLVENAKALEWEDYIRDYGVNKEGRLKYPVYDALGNHDGPGSSTAILNEVRKRNALRAGHPDMGVVNSDSLNYHYSWDWGQVHFVNLNLFSGRKQAAGVIVANHDPYKSLEFLKRDLETHVGASGRPVFVMQHYAFDGSSLDPIWGTQGWWTAADAEATYAILRNYNVIGLLHGHSHGMKFYKWKGLDVFDNGTAMNANILAFRITDTRMFAAAMTKGNWVSLKLDKAVSMGKPVSARREGRIAAARHGGERLAFSVSGQAGVVQAAGEFHRLEVRDIRGNLVRTLPVASARLHWDRRDHRGGRVGAGLYCLTFLGKAYQASRTLVLD